MSKIAKSSRRASPPRKFVRSATLALTLAYPAVLLGGCGGGVDLEVPFVGKISTGSKATDPEMAERSDLMLPPKVSSQLPAPVNLEEQAASGNWPTDPETAAKLKAKQAAERQARLEKDGDWKNEESSGNGLEDFNKKTDWQKRQRGRAGQLGKQITVEAMVLRLVSIHLLARPKTGLGLHNAAPQPRIPQARQ